MRSPPLPFPEDQVAEGDLATSIALLVAGIMTIQGVWLTFLTWSVWRQRKERHAEVKALQDAERRTVIEDIFLLHRSGILLKHYTRRLRPNIDSDLLSGMLVAVQEFIKDTFREEKGSLNEISFGEMRLVVVEGKWTILAGVVHGQHVMDILPELQGALRDLETKYEDPLLDWDGDMDSLPGVDKIMDSLIAGEYRGRKVAPPLEKKVIPIAPKG